MNKLTFIIAFRYLIGTKQEKNISTMVFICFASITIGSFALALIACIMNGFEKVTHKKMQSIHSQIIADADGQELDFKKISTVLTHEFPEIASFSPSIIKQVIAQGDEDEDYSVIILKGIDPAREATVNNLEKKIISSIKKEKKLSGILEGDSVLIGHKLAKNLEVTPGDTINLFFSPTQEIKRKKISLDNKEVIIGGTFKTGIDEFDTGLMVCSLDLTKKIFPESGIRQLSITLKENEDENKVIKKLKQRLKINVYSWKKLYPALVEALKLEKYAMFFILALITLVASMNIISLLFMLITKKRPDIAILKSMGLADNKISQIFLYVGMTISLAGSCLGLLLAFIAGWVLETYPFIKLPEAYYVTHLPAKMEFSIFFTVFVVVILISFFSTWFPTRKTRSIHISNVLRFEG